MDEQRFSDEVGPILETLRDDRGTCSEIEALLHADPKTLTDSDRLTIARHLSLCPTCAADPTVRDIDVDDLSWRCTSEGLDQRSKPWLAAERGRRGGRFRRPMLIAASLVIALAAATIWRQAQIDPDVGGSISTQRGTSIQTSDPSGSIDRLAEFRWQTVLPIEPRYRIELASDGDVVWRGETSDTFLAAPAAVIALLEPGKGYRWRVLGLDRDRVIAESSWTEFRFDP